MKIGIITHNIHYGYGGTLQAYALQALLRKLGHDPITFRTCSLEYKKTFLRYIRLQLGLVKRKLLCQELPRTFKQDNYISQNAEVFVKKYIKVTDYNRSQSDFLNNARKEKCDAFIVGSDQIWRSQYPFLFNTFLDFTAGMDVKRIAYAASFGIDEWEFTPIQTAKMKYLISFFDAVSVREKSGVELCKNYLGKYDVKHVLDPTLMLNKEDYIKLVEEANESTSDGDLFTYILDETLEKDKLIDEVSKKIGATRFECKPKYDSTYSNIKEHQGDCVYPPITKWLRSFMDAKLVITDSFHGTAFSIIFNKPFYVIINKERGAARFMSILTAFGLNNRIIHNSEDVDMSNEIDWNSVNKLRREFQIFSQDYLINALS